MAGMVRIGAQMRRLSAPYAMLLHTWKRDLKPLPPGSEGIIMYSPERDVGAEQSICLDFDDTICGADDRPLADARWAVELMRAWGYRVIVSSARFSPLYGDMNRFRMQKVERWLDTFGIEIDGVVYLVPSAEVYVDDLGWRYPGSIERLVVDLGASWGLGMSGRRISLSLDCILGPCGLLPGVKDGVEQLRSAGVELVVSAGPWVDPDGVEAAQDRIRARLRAEGLWPIRVEVAKISSHAYVCKRACRFSGVWQETVRELAGRLGTGVTPF